MANKRDFKKFVDALGASVIEEMMVAYYNCDGADAEAISAAAGKVITAIETAKDHSNIYFDRGARSFADHKEYSKAKRAFFKALFNKIIADFDSQLSEALKMFNGAIPAAVKEAQKG